MHLCSCSYNNIYCYRFFGSKDSNPLQFSELWCIVHINQTHRHKTVTKLNNITLFYVVIVMSYDYIHPACPKVHVSVGIIFSLVCKSVNK